MPSLVVHIFNPDIWGGGQKQVDPFELENNHVRMFLKIYSHLRACKEEMIGHEGFGKALGKPQRRRVLGSKHGLPERWEKFLSAMVTDDSSQQSRLKSVAGEEKEKQTHLLLLHTFYWVTPRDWQPSVTTVVWVSSCS